MLEQPPTDMAPGQAAALTHDQAAGPSLSSQTKGLRAGSGGGSPCSTGFECRASYSLRAAYTGVFAPAKCPALLQGQGPKWPPPPPAAPVAVIRPGSAAADQVG